MYTETTTSYQQEDVWNFGAATRDIMPLDLNIRDIGKPLHEFILMFSFEVSHFTMLMRALYILLK